MVSAPDTDTAEAYRLLHQALDSALPVDSRHGQVVVVAPISGRTPPVAANLALAAAAGGRVAMLVEGVPDRSARTVPAFLAPAGAAGLSDALLAGDDPIGHRTSGSRGLTVLGPGPDLDRAAEAFVGPRMRDVLDALRRAADLVVLTSPPLSDPDGQALAAVADHVLLLVTLDLTTRGQLDAALAEARRVHADVIGVVAVDPVPHEPTAVPAPVPPAGPEIVAPEQTAPATWVGT
jgi:Mrp family chromosome partitioning ATPase